MGSALANLLDYTPVIYERHSGGDMQDLPGWDQLDDMVYEHNAFLYVCIFSPPLKYELIN
jgi:hypothetical protein